MSTTWQTPISSFETNRRRVGALKSLGVVSVGDALTYYPFRVTEPVLAALRPGSLIVDLASRPGGTDFAAARRLGLTALHALSLPAACAPETAGEFVAQTVCEILREREGSA